MLKLMRLNQFLSRATEDILMKLGICIGSYNETKITTQQI